MEKVSHTSVHFSAEEEVRTPHISHRDDEESTTSIFTSGAYHQSATSRAARWNALFFSDLFHALLYRWLDSGLDRLCEGLLDRRSNNTAWHSAKYTVNG